MRAFIACLGFLVLAVPGALAQTGFPPFGSFSGSSFDTVNNANLNVHFQIPIVSKAGRGMPFYYMLGYDNSLWSPVNANGQHVWTPTAGWGWSGITDDATGAVSSSSSQMQNQCFWNDEYNNYEYTQYYGFTYFDPSGTSHWFPLNLNTNPDPTPPYGCEPQPPNDNEQGTAFASDGSGYLITVNLGSPTPAIITDTSGKVIVAPLDSTSGAGSITDSNGNKLTAAVSGGTTTFTDTLGTTALTVSGSNPLTYSYTNPSGGTSQVTLNYSTQTVQTNFGCSGISEFGPTSESLVSSITLPDGTSYTFTYEQTPGYPGSVTGRIASVTLPTGGTISYAYSGGSNGINCTDGSTPNLTRTTPDGTWSYTRSSSGQAVTTIADPQGNQTVLDFQGIYETGRAVYQGSSTLLETVTTCYYDGSASMCTGSSNTSLPMITQRTMTVSMGGLQSQTVTNYNSYGLPTEVDEYGYGNGAVGPLARKTITGYASLSNPNIQDRPSSVTVEDGSGNHVAATAYGYDGNGNLTSLNKYFNATTTIARYFTYGSYGVLQSATDFAGNSTSFTNGDCSGAFPTQVNQPLSLASSMTWDCGTGLVTSVTDPNNQVTSFSYDEFFRLAQTNRPDGGQTATTYNDNPGSSWSAVTTTALGVPGTRTDTALLDGLGRVTETQLNSDPAGADKVDTTYNALGGVARVSNPYRSSSTGGDAYSYDALGRVTSVTHADGNSVTTSYSGNCSTTTDEAGKSRELCADALGNVTKVIEDPGGLNYETDYAYDALGDLTQVSQGGQTRTYNYDMLSRLTSATTPESGTTTYSYSAAGGGLCSGDPSNVCTRADARGITTTYSYDALNRLTSKSYSDGTPTARFYYDGPPPGLVGWSGTFSNQKGYLGGTCTVPAGSSQCSGYSTATVNTYDPMGRILSYAQCTPYNCGSSFWQMTYSYDLAGDVTSWTHPAGFTITNSINPAQEITAIKSSLVDATHPQYLAQNITYTPWGAEQTLENGCAGSGCTNTVETYAYNNRLQPVMIELGTTSNAAADYCLVYNDYASLGSPGSCAVPSQGTGDNGNVRGYLYQDSVNSSLGHAATYSYDSLNRLTNAAATGSSTYNFTFQYDRWGNMTCTINGQTNGPCPEYSFNSANNQITNTGYTYDAAGNLTSDGTNTYQYDAEGRMISENNGTAGVYNALGEGVYSGGNSSVYGPAGHWLGPVFSSGEQWAPMIPAPDDRPHLAVYDVGRNQVEFVHRNLIGSTTINTTYSGAWMEDKLFYPWGQEAWLAGTQFEYHWAQFEGGGNGTLFRTYNDNLGRWFTPDPLGGDITNPQSLNRYAYALNNPTTLTDPLGLDPCTIDGQPAICTTSTATAPDQPPFYIGPCSYEAIEEAACYGGSSPAPPGWYEGSTSGGTSVAPAPAPKPAPPGLQVSTSRLIVDVNRCAAQKADSVSAASLLHLNNNPFANAFLGSSTASASRLVFGTNPSEYVPEGLNLVVGAKAGTALTATAQTAGRIEVGQGFQSVFTTVAPRSFGQTAVGQLVSHGASLTADLLDVAGKGLFVYDTAAYIGSLAACTW